MRTDELDYELPSSLVAQRPVQRRDGSRLMSLARASGRIDHHVFDELPDLVAPRSVIVLNDTKVFPARLAARKPTGGRAEVLLVRRLGARAHREAWQALVSARGGVEHGLELACGPLRVQVGARVDGPLHEVLVSGDGRPVMELVQEHGVVPLPPYIRRPADDQDRERYQTVYAKYTGSTAAPTAGLHFTSALLERLARDGHEIVHVTLHVGPGTFRPVQTRRVEDHQMHEEWVVVSEPAARAIIQARRQGRCVLAVGTTVVRALEGAAAARGALEPFEGPVDTFIQPGHEFSVVDELITNLHLPRSTLLALVMALSSREHVLAAYAEAVRREYRFYSYGDAMMLTSERWPRGGTEG